MPVLIGTDVVPAEASVVSGGAGSPDLVAYTDADPCPRVEITVTVAGTHTLTLWRTTEGQRVKVRGGGDVSFTDAMLLVDYEAPLSRTVAYSYSLDGAAEGPASTAYLPSDAAWIQDPLAPQQSAALSTAHGGGAVIRGSALTSLTYSMPSTLVPILGAQYPVALGGTRGAASRIPLDLFTNVAETTSMVHSILTTAFPVLLRPLPVMDPLPPTCFLAIADVVREPVTTFIGGNLTRWPITADLVAGPAISVIVPVWTYDDVRVLWTTYQAAQDGKPGASYLDWLRNPEP